MTDLPSTPSPGRTFVSGMQLSSKLVSADRSLMIAELRPELTTGAGTPTVGVLTTMCDTVASDPALVACSPDWTATLDLTIHGSGWLTDGPIVADARLVRCGKKVVVVTVDVWDAHGVSAFDEVAAAIDGAGLDGPGRLTHAARSLVTFARLPRHAAAGADDYDPGRWIGEVRERRADEPHDEPIVEAMGVRVLDAANGVLELDNSAFVANSIGTINGGAQAILVDAAAQAMRPELVPTDLEIHYLAQVKAGPAHTRGSVSRDAADHSVVAVEIVDAGADDHVLSLATVTLQTPAPST